MLRPAKSHAGERQDDPAYPMTDTLRLSFGLRFADLYDRDGLVRLDAAFVHFLKAAEAGLHDRLLAARAAPEQLTGKGHSDLIVALAPELEDFIAELFSIGGA